MIASWGAAQGCAPCCVSAATYPVTPIDVEVEVRAAHGGPSTKRPRMPPKREAPPPSERAASLLKRMRAQHKDQVSAKKSAASPARADGAPSAWRAASPSGADDTPVPLPRLIHALHTLAHVSVVDAMAIVRVLTQQRRNTRAHLQRISAPELEEIGAPCTGATRDRVVQVLRNVASTESAGGMSEAERMGQQVRLREDLQLRREWGNMHGAAARLVPDDDDDRAVYDFHAITQRAMLRGRHVVVNRAPVMTAWAVVVLQYMGFELPEALSLAQCYVSTTAEARARNLQLAHAKEEHVTSANQPHFEFLHVKIPVIHLRNGQYRGLHGGEVMAPSRAFDYLRRSMFQMLPHVIGAMQCLAESYLAPDGGADALHNAAYGLYVEFRPETHGEWGKRAELSLDKILALCRPPALPTSPGTPPREGAARADDEAAGAAARVKAEHERLPAVKTEQDASARAPADPPASAPPAPAERDAPEAPRPAKAEGGGAEASPPHDAAAPTRTTAIKNEPT